MAAANTDKLRKWARKWVGQIGSGGVSDAISTTIPLASTTNLPTDTAVTLIIDRVDSAGTKTPTLEETIVGVVSGTNIVNALRGVEGTAQAHNAGAVVELLVTSTEHNDLVDHLLVSHLQDGRLGGSVVTASNISSSAIIAGKISASAVVAGNLGASSVVAGNLSASSILSGNLAASSVLSGNIAASAVSTGNLNFTVPTTDGWVSTAVSLAYSSADDPTFVATTGSSLVSLIGVGDRIKLTQTTVKYFIVTAIDASTITLYGGTDYDLANAAISDVYYSHAKAPIDFPTSPAKWTVEVTDTTRRTQSSPAQNTWYNLGSISISIPIGVWRTNYQVALFLNKVSSGQTNAFVTLSTANNSESDINLTSYMTFNPTSEICTTMHREKTLTLAAKTAYYLNERTTLASMNEISIDNAVSTCIIRAVCAYL